MVKVRSTQVLQPESVVLNPGVVHPLPAPGWSAELTRLTAHGTSVDLVELGPHHYVSLDRDEAFPPALLLVAVASGRVQGCAGDDRFEVLPGQALLVDTRQPIRSRVDGPVRLLRTVVDHRRLPAPMLHRSPMPMTVLADSPVLQSCLAAASALLRRCRADEDLDDDESAIAHLLTGLHVGLLAESHRQHRHRDDADLRQHRRDRSEGYIEEHLTEPDLSPTAVARALGVSLRTLHGAWSGTDLTVAATIRRRRVELLQAVLRDRPVLPRLAELAEDTGFGDVDRMTRSFRIVTGRPLRRWFDEERSRT